MTAKTVARRNRAYVGSTAGLRDKGVALYSALRAARGIVPRKPAVYAKKKTATRTMTATKKLNQKAVEHRGGSESLTTLKKPATGMGKLIGKMSKFSRSQNAGFILTNTAGLQSSADVTTLFDQADTQAMMNDAVRATFAAGPGTVTIQPYKTQRVLFKSCVAEIAYTNNTNGICRLDLYDIVPRQDIYTTVTAAGTVGTTPPTTDPISPNTSWANGLADEDQAIIFTKNQMVGNLPFASEKFTHYFKVIKITHCILAPGQSHFHKIVFDPNHILSNEVLQQGNINGFKDLTMFHMAVQWGGPMDDNASSATTSATKLVGVVRKQYEFAFLTNNQTSFSYTTGIAATAGANIENLVTGATAAFATV